MIEIHDLSRFNTPPIHNGMNWVNQSVEWMPNDSKDVFEANMKVPNKRKYFIEQGWDQPGAITYNINRYGFRSQEPKEDTESIVFLGCSHTFGTGLPTDQIYATQLANMLQMPIYNLGVFGCALDTMFRLATYWIPIIKPKIVICMNVPWRMEYRMSSSDMTVFLGADGREITKFWFSCDENAQYNFAKNLLAIESISKDVGAKMFAYDAHTVFNNGYPDFARDMQHFGPNCHLRLAQKMYEEIS